MSKLQVERGNMSNFQAQGSILHLLGGRVFGKDFIGKETLSGNSDEAVRMFICNQYSMSYAVNRETGEVILERKWSVKEAEWLYCEEYEKVVNQ